MLGRDEKKPWQVFDVEEIEDLDPDFSQDKLKVVKNTSGDIIKG
jgi:hypothetical protein